MLTPDKEKAWGYNEVKADSGRPSTNNIFGAAKTGNTIIDALDTLWIMQLKEYWFLIANLMLNQLFNTITRLPNCKT